MHRLRLAMITLLLPLAAGCDDKDPTVTTTENATSTQGDTTADVVTTSVGEETNADTTSDPPDPPETTTTGEDTTVDPPETTTTPPDPTVDPPETTTVPPTTEDPTDPPADFGQQCVDIINMYRATLGLPPYERWFDAEVCSNMEAQSDGQSGTPHGAFGQCGEYAQNECPGWPGPPEAMLEGCLAQMWAEGPGEDFSMHGHYINMSSTQYTKVACGLADLGGDLWSVQNFQ